MTNKTKGFNPKKFAVVGAGPVGSIVAAFLAKGGCEVILCDVLPEILAAAIDPGIRITGAHRRTCSRKARCYHHCGKGHSLASHCLSFELFSR